MTKAPRSGYVPGCFVACIIALPGGAIAGANCVRPLRCGKEPKASLPEGGVRRKPDGRSGSATCSNALLGFSFATVLMCSVRAIADRPYRCSNQKAPLCKGSCPEGAEGLEAASLHICIRSNTSSAQSLPFGHHPAQGRALATLAHCKQWAALVRLKPDLRQPQAAATSLYTREAFGLPFLYSLPSKNAFASRKIRRELSNWNIPMASS